VGCFACRLLRTWHRQADICLRLALIASDEEAAGRLLAIHQHYKAKADAMEAEGEAPRVEMTNPNASPGSGKHHPGADS
jgi:hypothetical protein